MTKPNPNNSSQWSLTVNTFIESATKDQTLNTILEIKLDKSLVHNMSHSVKPGADGSLKLETVISVDKSKVIHWFPNGVANNTQKLYQLDVSIRFNDSSETSNKTKKIGFRTIELIQKAVKPEGLTFYFAVNSIPFYAKGSNWIPANTLMEDLTPDYLRHILLSAKDANMNMIRIWGGGVYESDLFYELADELGIMIWHDFMFACALYLANPEFLDSVDVEVVQQVRRLQHHPSIAIWAGIEIYYYFNN